MVLFFLFLFNGFILFYAAAVGWGLFHPLTSFDVFLCGLGAFLVVSGLIFLFDSPLGQWFLRLTSGARSPIEREERYLQRFHNYQTLVY